MNPTTNTALKPSLFFLASCNLLMIGNGNMYNIRSVTTSRTPTTTFTGADFAHLAKVVASQGDPLLGVQNIAAIATFDQ